MTYCLAWKSNGAIFMAGDTVVTLYSDNMVPETGEVTTFAERQGVIKNKNCNYFIEERALKLYDFSNSAACFAGSAYVGRNLIDTLRQYLDLGTNPREALSLAIQNLHPFSAAQEDRVSFLYGFYENGKGILLQVETWRNGAIAERDGLVQIGSISQYHQDISAQIIPSLDQILYRVNNPTAQHIDTVLVQLLALVQSYGIYRILPQEYVGGAFCGLAITPSGIQWQPHILYVLHPPEPTSENLLIASVSVVERTLCIINNSTGQTKVITNPEPDEAADATVKRAEEASETMITDFDQGLFDYICFLNRQQHIVTVVEMRKKISHGLLYLDTNKSATGRIGIMWSPGLLNQVNSFPRDEENIHHDLCIKYLSYWPMSEEDLEFVKNNIDGMRD